jgi:hypothetical protein
MRTAGQAREAAVAHLAMSEVPCCGNANAAPNPEECSSLGLAAAKEAVDACLSGTPARVQTKSVAAARELVSKLAGLCFVARVTYGKTVGPA